MQNLARDTRSHQLTLFCGARVPLLCLAAAVASVGKRVAHGSYGWWANMQEQKSLLKEQDAEVDQIHDAVKRVKALGGVMRDELQEQNVILENLEDDVERADSGMQTMQKKLKSLVTETQSSDRAMYSIIACLVIVLVILTGMVMS